MATQDQEDRGKCVSCGFLAVTAFWSEDHAPQEIGLYDRRHAQLTGFPTCFTQTEDLYQELRDADTLDRPVDAQPAEFGSAEFAAVLGKDRHCPEWFRFQPGRSLEQHLDDKIQMQLEQQRQAHDLRIVTIEAKIQADSLSTAEATKRWTRWGVILAVIVVILTAASVAASVYFGSRPVTVHVEITTTPTP